jgi:hypothetical protein
MLSRNPCQQRDLAGNDTERALDTMDLEALKKLPREVQIVLGGAVL